MSEPEYSSKQLRAGTRQRLLAWTPCRHPDGVICVHRQWAYDHWLRGFHKGFSDGTLRERRHQAEARLAAEDAKKATPEQHRSQRAMTDQGRSALAERLHLRLCGNYAPHLQYSHDPDAAAILGEHGLFIADASKLRDYLRANLFDGDEAGQVTMPIATLLDDIVGIFRYMAEDQT